MPGISGPRWSTTGPKRSCWGRSRPGHGYGKDSTNRTIPAILRTTQYQRGVWSMKKILFVCHGNICRSPMAEYVMKDLVKKADLEGQLQIASAATSREEIGNPVYPPDRRKLAEHGISCDGHAARQLRSSDYEEYDLLIGMDMANLRNMCRACGGDPDGKIHLLMEYADRRKGPPREPGGAGRVGRGEARKRSEFSPQAETEKSRLCFDEVADPWYTGDFDATWRDVLAGCQGLLDELIYRGRTIDG